MPPIRRAPSRPFAAMLLASVLAVAACTSSDQVEVADTSEADVTTETTEAVEETAGGDDDELVETETNAMGEDDGDPTSGTTVPDDEPSSDNGDTGNGATESSSIDDAELAAALEAGQNDMLSLPFMYVTAEQDCDGCAESVSLYYEPGLEQASILVLGGAYVDGSAVDFADVDPTLVAGDPRLIAEVLSASADNGDVSYSIDPVSGLITRWTVDGNTVTLRCLQVDTRPIDLRSEVCRDSLIG